MHICTSSLRERPVLVAASSSFASMVSGSHTDTTVDFATAGLHCGTINLSSCACNIRKSGESWCCRSAAIKAAGQRPSRPKRRGLNCRPIRWSTAAIPPAVRLSDPRPAFVEDSAYCIGCCTRAAGGTVYTLRYAERHRLQICNIGSARFYKVTTRLRPLVS